jgi:hypothetical protein
MVRESTLEAYSNESHAERLKALKSIPNLMGKIDRILQEKIKQKSTTQIQSYINIAEPTKNKLIAEIQSYFPDERILPIRDEAQSDIQQYRYFISDYIRLILIRYMIDSYTHVDFHTHADEQIISKIKQAEDYIEDQKHKAESAYTYLKKAKRNSDAHFNQQYIEHHPKLTIKKYIEGEGVDYINTMPYSAITDEDIDNAYQALMKMVHWTIYANDDVKKLLQGNELFSKKTSGGQDSSVEKIFKSFMEALYKPLYIAGIPLIHSAIIIKAGFDYINKPFIEAYANDTNINAFVYEVSTIEKKLKPVKVRYKSKSLAELIP